MYPDQLRLSEYLENTLPAHCPSDHNGAKHSPITHVFQITPGKHTQTTVSYRSQGTYPLRELQSSTCNLICPQRGILFFGFLLSLSLATCRATKRQTRRDGDLHTYMRMLTDSGISLLRSLTVPHKSP